MNRTPCIVPHCKRTRESVPHFDEFICGKHWSTTSRKIRRIYHARKHRLLKGDMSQAPKLQRLWEKLKNQAMEGAMYQ